MNIYYKGNLHLFGFYFGDGTKRNNRTIAITNSNPFVIKEMIKIFDLFEIPREKLKASITLKTKSFIDTKEYWSEITKIPIKNFQKTNWREGTSLVRDGSIKIEYYSVDMKKIFDRIFEQIKTEVLGNNDKAISFLRGLIAADGAVAIRNNQLHKIMLCVFGKERIYLKKLLKKLGINFYEEKEALSVANKKDINILKEKDIFCYHNERRSKFLQLGVALHT